jgi:hypothetical protein
MSQVFWLARPLRKAALEPNATVATVAIKASLPKFVSLIIVSLLVVSETGELPGAEPQMGMIKFKLEPSGAN